MTDPLNKEYSFAYQIHFQTFSPTFATPAPHQMLIERKAMTKLKLIWNADRCFSCLEGQAAAKIKELEEFK